MLKQRIGAGTRRAANALTIVIAAFAAFGWCAEVSSWPPQMSDGGTVAMAAATFIAQLIANGMAAEAKYASRRGEFATAVGAAALGVVFAGVVAFGIGHAFTVQGASMRERAAASIASELAAAATDARAANARLTNLPTDIPASRLVVLQAPLRAALETAEAQEADARARYAAATAPSPNDALFQRIFELLSFCEIGLYWVLAASHPAVSPSQSQRSKPSRETPRQSRRPGRGMLRALLGGAAFAWSAAAPAAARPPILPRVTTSVVGAAPPPYAPTAASSRSRFVPGSAAPRVPRATATERDAGIRNGTPPPPWLDTVRALRASGLSYRAIATRIGVPKSTVFRWLN